VVQLVHFVALVSLRIRCVCNRFWCLRGTVGVKKWVIAVSTACDLVIAPVLLGPGVNRGNVGSGGSSVGEASEAGLPRAGDSRKASGITNGVCDDFVQVVLVAT
jgi:hypothetical protein